MRLHGARLAVAAANTALAAAASVVAAGVYMQWRLGALDPSLMSNALLAGLVSVAAGCAFVSTAAAVGIGAIGGVLVIVSVLFLERTLHIDDPAGVVSIHGTCGAWGLLAAGLFANGRYGDGLNGVPGPVTGLFYGGASQLLAQAVGALVVAAVAFGAGYGVFQTIGRTIGNRVSPTAELDGLDMAELGTSAYPDFGRAAAPSDLQP